MTTTAELIRAATTTLDPELAEALVTAAYRQSIRDAITSCTACPLHLTSTQRVPFTGTKSAIALVGEAPGAQEDRQGEPFVGPAGRLLDSMLLAAGMRRTDMFLLNVVCCRPPRNDFATAISVGAVESCAGHFRRSLEWSGAWLIVPMGNAALSQFKPGASISSWRGKVWWEPGYLIAPTFHPAYALRNPEGRSLIESDLARIHRIATVADSPPPVPKSYDPTFDLADFAQTTVVDVRAAWKRQGWAMVWSPWLSSHIVLRRDESITPPLNLPTPYTVAEAVSLRGQSLEFRRAVHLVKQELGAGV